MKQMMMMMAELLNIQHLLWVLNKEHLLLGIMVSQHHKRLQVPS
jgi:hypothetical protein